MHDTVKSRHAHAKPREKTHTTELVFRPMQLNSSAHLVTWENNPS